MVRLAQVGSSDKGRDMERPERDSEREMYGLAIDMTDLGERGVKKESSCSWSA